MKNIKKIIPILIIFLTIGFAAVNYTLSLDGDTNLTGDLEDFKVYFSRVLINGVEDNSIVSSATQLDFSNKLTNIGQEYVVDYDVTNASKFFDASITLSCTEGNEYLSVTNTFDTSNLTSLATRTGKLVLKRLKSLASNDSQFTKITCTINAQPIERETLGEGTITNPVNPYYIGREVSIGNEKFNIIREQKDTITMLAQYNIGTDFKQNTEDTVWLKFSDDIGWEYTPGPLEIDIQQYDGPAKKYVNNYVSYLKSQYGIDTEGNLITLKELEKLGCTIPADYAKGSTSWNCFSSPHTSWLINDHIWWTRSSSPESESFIWVVGGTGYLAGNGDYSYGIRPTITISKKTAQLLLKTYRVGQEISIGDEKFNVISDNGTTISMLAKYNIGTDNRQSTTSNPVALSDSLNWDIWVLNYDINILEQEGKTKDYITSYISYLKESLSTNDIQGRLIKLKELGNLRCVVPEDYSWVDDEDKKTCANSPHISWLINGQSWRTSSVGYGSEGTWVVYDSSPVLRNVTYKTKYGVRPVITISKVALE